MRNSRLYLIGAVVIVVVIILGVLQTQRRKPLAVKTATVSRQDIVSSFSAEAYVKTRSVVLAPRISAQVVEILVEEGERVNFGDILIKLDDKDIRAALSEAEAGVNVATAAVKTAEDAIQITRDQTLAQERMSRATLDSYQSRLDRLKAGARPEEIQRAGQEVKRAKASLDEARSAFERAERLYDEGATSKAKFDQAKMYQLTAEAVHAAAIETVTLLKAGPTEEDVRTAQAEVRMAQAGLDASIAATGEVRIRENERTVATRRLEQAIQTRNRAQTALEDAIIKAPFSGVIANLHVEVGDLVSPLRPAASFVEQDGMEIEAEIGDQDIAKITVGQDVEVTTASYPGRVFNGIVVRIADEAEQKPDTLIRTRIVRVTIDPDEEAREVFKSGMEVDVQGKGIVATNVLTMPSDALITEDGDQFVWVLTDGRVQKREIEIGSYTFDVTEVVSGLDEGDTVILSPKDELSEDLEVSASVK